MLVGAASASATEVSLMNISRSGIEVVGVGYSLDRKSGSAYVNVGTFDRELADSVCGNMHSNCGSTGSTIGLGTTKVVVKGLIFDSAASQVVYTNDAGAKTVCATVVQKKFLFHKIDTFKTSEACKFQYRKGSGFPQDVKLVIAD
jgi:hypothetical protein